VSVVPLAPEQSDAAGNLLSRAFVDDPVWRAVFPDDQRRPAALASMFRALVRVHRYSGRALTTPTLQGVALWRPPGRGMRAVDTLRSGFAMPRAVAGFTAAERSRLLATLRQFEGRRALLVPRPHWYLEVIGVDPTHQGLGCGTALVSVVLDEADAAGAPAYLETETEANVQFYERLGFEVAERHIARAVDCPVWLMVRQPR
jgi:GNAT superfamily N-acetyltransferase